MSTAFGKLCFLVLLSFTLPILLDRETQAQTSDVPSGGRVDQIEAQRLDKANHIGPNPAEAPEKDSRLQQTLHFVPISFEVGGLGPGAGPAINAAIQKSLYDDRLVPKIWGHLALHNFYRVGAGAALQNFSTHDLKLLLEGSYSNAPQLEYYGSGPNSSIHNRTDFKREDSLFHLGLRLRPSRNINAACSLGQRLIHIGPGTNDALATTQSEFGPAEAPGIDTPSNDYLIAGCQAELDFRDFPGDPHKGGYVRVALDRYYAEDYSRFSFYRPTLEGEQYLPFFNRKRVIALRAKTELSFHHDDQVVPFYLDPTLGSDTELRGFRRYRFYDENSISATAEYRWEISTGFDMALFVDGGDVFHRPSQCFSQMKSSVGFGLRVKNQSERRLIGRLDVGFSQEGFQVWLKIPAIF